MIPKLNKASYLIRVLKPLLSLESLKMVYFSLFHSVTAYGIIFWGVSTYSKIIFKIQKRIVRIITSAGRRDSCRDIFKKLSVLPLQSQYIFSLLMFIVKNKEFFKTNLEVHRFNRRANHDLYIPVANLSIFRKGVCYFGTKLFNHLPLTLKQLSNDIPKFRASLKRFLLTNSFYTVEEYYCWK
jgi:hypothetical protein